MTEQLIFPEIDYDKVAEDPRDGHHDRDDGEERRRGPGAARALGFPFAGDPGGGGVLGERDMAKKALMEQAGGAGQVRVRELHALPAVRPCPSRLPAVPALPHLFPRARARGRAAGGDEGVMVKLRHPNVTDPVARHADAGPQRQHRLQGRPVRPGVEDEPGAPADPHDRGLRERLRRGGRGDRARVPRRRSSTAPSRERTISGIKRVSKPGRRVYAGKGELPRVLGGLGVAILSTSQGVADRPGAPARGVGGEVLAYVW